MKPTFLGLLALLLVAACSVAGPSNQTAWQDRAEPQDIIAESLASSVQLFAQREVGRRAGSGVVLDVDDGRALVLTAGHLLVPGAEQSVVAIAPGSGARLEASLLLLDEAADIALFEVEGLAAPPVRLKEEARLGDPVWVVSFPWGRRGTFVTGVVSQIADRDGRPGIPIAGPVGLIDAAVSYGTSGGGVFDARSGRLLGIVRGYRTAKITLPGGDAGKLEFPIAGETTVIPTTEILCRLGDAGLETNTALPLAEGATACRDVQMERAEAAR
ncbi:MAG: serine protease [Kiloniellales bacterium]|nr:serine protease [Kiloniellales bacterium]